MAPLLAAHRDVGSQLGAAPAAHRIVLLIPGSADTFGHGTTGNARFWKNDLAQLLQSAPRLPH